MVFHLCLTNECQCNCFYCSQHVRSGRGEFLPEEHAVELAKKAFELGYDTIELIGGEPLLHPGFDRIIEKMGKDVPDIKMVLCTNGILLEKHISQIRSSGMKRIKLHLDTVLAQDYKAITGLSAQLNQILNGLWKSVAAEIETDIIVKLHPYSAGQLGVLLSLAKKYPVHIQIQDLITEKETYTERDILLKWRSVIGKTVKIQEHVYTGEGWKGTFSLKLSEKKEI